MKTSIKFKTRTDELGNTFANIDDLIPSELNKRIYGNEDAEDSKVNEIAEDMKDRMTRELSANSTPVPVYPSGKMKGGHTRRLAGRKAGAKELQINILTAKEEIEIQNNSYAEVLALLSDNVLKRDKDHETILNEYNEVEMAYVQTNNQQPTKEDKQFWINRIQSGTTHRISMTMMDQLKIIKTKDPSLFKKIKAGKMTPKAAYNSVKNLRAKLLPRKNRGILEVFDNEANVKMFKHLFNSGVEKFKKDNTLTYPNGETINWITDEYCGVESNYISNSFSQILQGSVTAMFRKQYPNWDARTPRSEIGAPDTQFHAFNIPGYDTLRLESKCFDMLANVPTVYFGLGGAMINPHEFIMLGREGLDRFCIFVTTLSNEEERDIKGQGSGSIMTIQTWFDNHFDKKDWKCLHGEIRRDQNGKMNMICEKL
jgi:hypothetical protein